MRKLSDESINSICFEYVHDTTTSTNSLGIKYGVAHETIRAILERNGINRRPRRKYSVNDSYFSSLEHEHQSYWLGFLAADGNVRSSRVFKLTLGEQDKEYLDLFNKDLDGTYRVCCYKRKADGIITCDLVVSSRQIVKDLSTYGIIPRKTFTLPFPTNIPSDLIRHYIRGYFDGDGSFIVRYKEGHTPYISASITGNTTFIKDLQNHLVNTIDVGKAKLIIECEGISAIRMAGRMQVIRFYKYMYDDSTIYLERKKKKVENILRFDDPSRISPYHYRKKSRDDV